MEVFRDENVAYASNVWASGVQCELHVWAGAFHASDMMCQNAELSVASKAARSNWVRRSFVAQSTLSPEVFHDVLV